MRVSNRRDFLRIASSTGLAIASGTSAVYGEAPAILPGRKKSRIILARRPGKLLIENHVDRNQIEDLINQSVCALLDEKDSTTAWKKLFTPKDTVGIKVNSLGGKGISPKPELVAVICDALQRAGVPSEQIIVWDRFSDELKRAGYTLAVSGSGPRCYGTDALGHNGYDSEPEISGTISSCFSGIISRQCTAMINVGVLKDHDLSGISAGMKNLFGLIHNPNRYHFDVHKDPYLADLAMHPYVRKKSRLVIIDGLTGQYNGGPAYKPQYTWPYEGIMVGTDVVAIDRIGCQIIETQRKEAGLKSLSEIDREPKYIDLAEERGIGHSDLSKIGVIEVT